MLGKYRTFASDKKNKPSLTDSGTNKQPSQADPWHQLKTAPGRMPGNIKFFIL